MLLLKFQSKTQICNSSNIEQILNNIGINRQECYFVSSGKIVKDVGALEQYSNIQVHLKLLGGKGGFGAKLKNEGGKKVKPNENMFSRDVHGRPIAYSTLQRDYKEYYSKKCEQDEKVNKQLSEFKVMANTLKQQYTSNKLDRTYKTEIDEVQTKLSNSLKTGLSKYLAKKAQDASNSKQKTVQKIQEQIDSSAQQKFMQKIQKQNIIQEQSKQKMYELNNNEGKRQRNNFQGIHQQDKGPSKKIKPNQEIVVVEKKNQEKVVAVQTTKPPIKLLSAKQKLKNLFKK